MKGLFDFFSPEAGQRRRAALDEFGRDIGYYVPPELRGLLGLAAEISPTATVDRAATASMRAADPSRTASQRIGDVGNMLSEVAGVVGPAAVANRAAMPAAQALQEGMMGFSMGAQDLGRTVVDRLNQPGPVPTMYSNPIMGASRNVDDYVGSHRAPSREYGASLDDPREMFGGDDIYSENAMRYFGHGDTAMDRESIRAINAARGNPDSEITVYRAVPSDLEGAVVNAGDWVTPSRKYAEMHGEGPLGGDYQIIEERVRAGDLFTDGDIHEWGYTPEPQTPAQRVAGLLSSGRADEVTDEMMAAADPQEMARLYASGATGMDLPMDEASRMARAREMGFTDEGYHGSVDDILAFRPSIRGKLGPGVYTAPEAPLANSFAGKIYGEREYLEGGNVLPLFVRSNPAPDMFRSEASALARAEGDPFRGAEMFTNYLDNLGFTGVKVNSEQTTLNPANIRSRFARFDPRLSHLANLSAGIGGLGLLGYTAMQPEEEQY